MQTPEHDSHIYMYTPEAATKTALLTQVLPLTNPNHQPHLYVHTQAKESPQKTQVPPSILLSSKTVFDLGVFSPQQTTQLDT